jgi:hypothetical protein
LGFKRVGDPEQFDKPAFKKETPVSSALAGVNIRRAFNAKSASASGALMAVQIKT